MPNKAPWYLKDSKIAQALEKFKDASDEESFLDAKTKALLKMVAASVLRCHDCTASHIKSALALGVSKKQITEALLMASVMGATTQVSWDLDDFVKYLGD